MRRTTLVDVAADAAFLDLGVHTGAITSGYGRWRVRSRPAEHDAPTIVFESAMGTSSTVWWPVISRLDGRLGVLAYDRSGLGGSPRDDRPRTLQCLVDDLRLVLAAVEPGPFILVGHSWGGAIVRRLATTDAPPTLIGVVHVDPTHEDALTTTQVLRNRAVHAVLGAGLRLGPTNLLLKLDPGGGRADCPRAVSATITAEMIRSLAEGAARRESDHLAAGLALLRSAADGSAALRHIVLTAGRQSPRIRTAHSRLAADMQATHEVVLGSGHWVPLDAPDAVVSAVQTMGHA